MVTPLIRRRPQVVARQAVALDRLSRGHLVMGFGIGDDDSGSELACFGELTDAAERGRALDEGLAIFLGLVSGEEVTRHQGMVAIQMTEPEEVGELKMRLEDAGADLDRFDIVVWARRTHGVSKRRALPPMGRGRSVMVPDRAGAVQPGLRRGA